MIKKGCGGCKAWEQVEFLSYDLSYAHGSMADHLLGMSCADTVFHPLKRTSYHVLGVLECCGALWETPWKKGLSTCHDSQASTVDRSSMKPTGMIKEKREAEAAPILAMAQLGYAARLAQSYPHA